MEHAMTPLSIPAEALAYRMAVIALFLDLPHSPLCVSASDQRQAHHWFQHAVPLATVEAALWLGSLRRLVRPGDAPPLSSIRSLAYFQPIVEELLQAPVPDSYRAHLQFKIQPYLRSQPGVQDSGR
jgi:hypothetical protein